MALIVQKYGGTSVGSVERINAVADRVIKTRDAGHDVVVVVSAMGGETDRLLGMARELHPKPDAREYSMLLSTGEQVSMSLLCMALHARGHRARSYTGWQVRLKTTDDYKKARILDVDCSRIHDVISNGEIAVVAGFQGVDSRGEITTLGRGGSDLTGVALAASLKADECQIYTDVDGVYTADPRLVPKARRLEQITFDEMFEMASLGAKVLQSLAVEHVGHYRVPLRVLSSFVEGPGTLVSFDEEKTMTNPGVSGIAYNRNEAKLTILGVPDRPGVAAQILGPVSDAQIDIDMVIQNVGADGTTDFTFTVHRDDYQRAYELLEAVKQELGAIEVVGNQQIAKLSLVGVGMRSHPGIASTMFKVLGSEQINIQMITTSEIKVSVVVDEKYLELGVRALHSAFGLDSEPVQEHDPVTTGK